MENWKDMLSKLSGKTPTKTMTPAIRKAVLSAVTATALSLGAGSVDAEASSKKSLTTMYYVYLNKEYMGRVSDKNIVEEELQSKLSEAQQKYGTYDITFGDVTYVPEKVLSHNPKVDNEAVLSQIESELEVQADSVAITLEGETVAYLENQQAAEEVIKKLKLKYVSEQDLQLVEANKADSNKSLPPLAENQSRIYDVKLSKNVSFLEKKISPDEILTVDQVIELLLKGTLEEEIYKVQEGDVLGTIANSHNLKIAQLLELNPGLNEDSVLKIGQEINVTMYKPYIAVIVEKEVNQKEQIPFKKEVVTDNTMFKGDTKVKQQGKNGVKSVTYVISEQNGKVIKKETVKSEELQAPVTHIVISGTKVVPSRGVGSFIWPAQGGYISSHVGYRWGQMHKGIDIARPSGYTIKAADNGVVVFSGWDGSFGNKVVIDHQNGFRTIYAHLASLNVRSGQTVPRGANLGQMGRTGNSTGVHLHFEMYLNGKLVNPTQYVKR